MSGRPVTPEAAVERLRLAWSQVARAQRLAVDEDRDHDAILLGEVLGMLGERSAGLDPFPMGMAGQCKSVSAGVRCPLPDGHGRVATPAGTWDHATAGRVWDDPLQQAEVSCPAAAESTATALALTLAETRGRQAAFNLAAQMIENHCEWLDGRTSAAHRDRDAQGGRQNYLSAASAATRADALGEALQAARDLLSQVQALEGDAG